MDILENVNFAYKHFPHAVFFFFGMKRIILIILLIWICLFSNQKCFALQALNIFSILSILVLQIGQDSRFLQHLTQVALCLHG